MAITITADVPGQTREGYTVSIIPRSFFATDFESGGDVIPTAKAGSLLLQPLAKRALLVTGTDRSEAPLLADL